MEKEKFNKLITDAAKTIFTYCRTRTNTKEEAEDLSQDILLELLKSQSNLRDDKAFYGFMWAVARNVYKEWCKKRKKFIGYELHDSLPDSGVLAPEWLEHETDISLLHRELDLLTEQYRKVVTLYYFDGVKVSGISKSLAISESMVKFLLFKSRKILKEGMNMERTKGDLSFNPGRLDIHFYGGENFNPEKATWDYNGSLIAQNILLACYNDSCTAEEISIQLGVAVPYLESDLQMLCRSNLLTKKGSRYETSVVIFTSAFATEANEKAQPIQREIAELMDEFLRKHLDDINAMDFYKGVEDDNLLKWHIATLIFNEAVLKKYHNSLNPVYPTQYLGVEAFPIVTEPNPNGISEGVSILTPRNNGDYVFYMGILVEGLSPSGNYFVSSPSRVNLMTDIAKGKTHGFNASEKDEIAELIKRGFIRKSVKDLSLKFPVFTQKQYADLLLLIDSTTSVIAKKAQEMIKLTTDILVQHSPASMKKEAASMGWVTMIFDGAIVAPSKIMLENGALQRFAENTYSAAYIVTALRHS